VSTPSSNVAGLQVFVPLGRESLGRYFVPVNAVDKVDVNTRDCRREEQHVAMVGPFWKTNNENLPKLFRVCQLHLEMM